MCGSRWLCFIVLVLSAEHFGVQGQFAIPDVQLEAYSPAGLQVSIKALPGMQMFGFHAKINSDIGGVEPGDLTAEVKNPDVDGYFRSFDPSVTLKPGDRVNYWVYVQHNNLGYRKVKLSWIVNELKQRNTDCIPSITTAPGSDRVCSGDLLINDAFSSIDSTKWTVEQYLPDAPDYEFVIYRNEQVNILNGKLSITPSLEQDDGKLREPVIYLSGCTRARPYCSREKYLLHNPVNSGMVTSRKSFSYADIEIKARLPAGDWIYPEIYLEEEEPFQGTRAKILIAYARGNKKLVGNSGDDIGGSFLFGGPVISESEPGRSRYLVSYKNEAGPLSNEFHTYRLKWTSDVMELYLDGNNYGRVKTNKIKSDKFSGNTPSQFRLVLGIGVGGVTDFPDNYKSGDHDKPWINGEGKMVKLFNATRTSWLPTWSDKSRLEVEYVRVKAI